MPYPLSGAQRHLVSAIDYLQEGESISGGSVRLKEKYTYLTDSEASQIMLKARDVLTTAGFFTEAEPGEQASDYFGPVNAVPGLRIAEGAAEYVLGDGSLEYRTIRVRVNPGDTVQDVLDSLRNAADDLREDQLGDGSDRAGNIIGAGLSTVDFRFFL
jgi:hypothetical protein